MDARFTKFRIFRKILNKNLKEAAGEIGISGEALRQLEVGESDLMNYKSREKFFQIYEDYEKQAKELIDTL